MIVLDHLENKFFIFFREKIFEIFDDPEKKKLKHFFQISFFL